MASEFRSSSSSSSSSRLGWKYDVFLSFRGEDTRKTFTDHLHTALVQAGIHTFRDDEELPRGEEISPQLIKAIQGSRICIVVFSKGYASSTWCLDELGKIMECKNNNTGQIVLPVFYNIDPSNVRKQKRSFAEAFEMHEKCFKEEMEKVKMWRKALKEAANLSGFDLNNMANGHESKCIQKIVEDVRIKLDHKSLYVAKHPVGIDTNVDNIINLLSIYENDIGVLGIYGMPGKGKTTIAKAVFNCLCYGFEGCCYLFNVKEKSKQDNGLVQLQKQLLCDILKSNGFEFSDECRGVNVIKERLSRKRILVVVDDVDQFKQLQYLVGERSWFGGGSRIIITTRDEHLLTQFEVDEKFKVEQLNQDESLELFSCHAFRDTHPSEDRLELSYGVVKYCGGLPLALEVLGSSLFKRSKDAWESTVKKLQKIPNNQIQEKIQISFDTLDDDTFKDAFLDIACFFIGWNKEYVAEILDGQGFYANICLAVLLERSLVTINNCNQFDMHDLIRDMGREIVRKMSLNNPGKRSRIWFHEDALDVLNKHMGTAIVKGLKLDVRSSEAVCVSTKSFTEMTRLQLLQINGVHLSGSYEHFPKELIWLCWLECPLKYVPSNLELDNIVILDMQHSDLKELWQEIKILNKLKILNLSHSKYLCIAPNFLGFSNLERLVLEDCPNLSEVHPSIGHLGRLVFLNLKGCCRLKILPESMGNLKSLETLNIAECSNLEKLPEYLGDMESLTELIAEGTAIRQLPSSIGQLKKLRKLSLGRSNWDRNLPSTSWFSVISSWLSPRSSNSKALLPASFSGLSSLRELDLSYCGLSDRMISKTDFGRLSSLENLYLSGNKFFNLPSGIGCLPRLQILRVNGCTNLVSISELPSSLIHVDANDCTSMESLSILSKARLGVTVRGCQNLTEIQAIELERVSDRWCLILSECNNLSIKLKKSILQELCKSRLFDIVIRGGAIPEWFSHRGEGSSLSFKVPDAVSDGIVEALLVWVVCVGVKYADDGYDGQFSIWNKSNGKELLQRSALTDFGTCGNEQCWVSLTTLTGPLDPCAMQSGDELVLSVSSGICEHIKMCGVHMIVKRPDVVESSTDARWKSCLMRELQQAQIRNLHIAMGDYAFIRVEC